MNTRVANAAASAALAPEYIHPGATRLRAARFRGDLTPELDPQWVLCGGG